MKDWFEVRKIAPNVHLIQEVGQVNAYLIQGSDHAALIDSGLGIGDIHSIVERLTSLPVTVLNTHGHWDHVGGNSAFEQVGIHPLEEEQLAAPHIPDQFRRYLLQLEEGGYSPPRTVEMRTFEPRPSRATFHVEQGQMLDLGGRQLMVWHTPGHSPGSVCFVDEAERLLFAGDSLYEGAIYLHLPGSDATAMLESYSILAEMAWDINLVLPGHGTTPTDGRLILEVREGLRHTLAGEISLKKGASAFDAARIAVFDRFMFFLPPDWRPAPSHV